MPGTASSCPGGIESASADTESPAPPPTPPPVDPGGGSGITPGAELVGSFPPRFPVRHRPDGRPGCGPENASPTAAPRQTGRKYHPPDRPHAHSVQLVPGAGSSPGDSPASGYFPSPQWGRHGLSFARSEEHTSELQSLRHLVCRLLLEKKK